MQRHARHGGRPADHASPTNVAAGWLAAAVRAWGLCNSGAGLRPRGRPTWAAEQQLLLDFQPISAGVRLLVQLGRDVHSAGAGRADGTGKPQLPADREKGCTGGRAPGCSTPCNGRLACCCCEAPALLQPPWQTMNYFSPEGEWLAGVGGVSQVDAAPRGAAVAAVRGQLKPQVWGDGETGGWEAQQDGPVLLSPRLRHLGRAE